MTVSSFSRRSVLKGSGIAGAAALVATLVPEFGNATKAAGATRNLNKLQQSAIATCRSNPLVQKIFRSYKGFTFDWNRVDAVVGEQIAWVKVAGSKQSDCSLVYSMILVNLQTHKVMLVEHALISPDTSGTHEARMSIAFNEEAPVWRGYLDKKGEPIAAAGYADPKALQRQMHPASCSSIMGEVCSKAADGDSILACAIFAETGPGGIACSVVLAIISWWGCSKATHAVCG